MNKDLIMCSEWALLFVGGYVLYLAYENHVGYSLLALLDLTLIGLAWSLRSHYGGWR